MSLPSYRSYLPHWTPLVDSDHVLHRFPLLLAGILCALFVTDISAQQRIQFPSGVPQGTGSVTPPPATLGTQIIPFDPYAMPNAASPTSAPVLPPLNSPPASAIPPSIAPDTKSPQETTTAPIVPQTVPNPPAANLPPVLPPNLPPMQPPPPLGTGPPASQSPPAMFPNGINWKSFGQSFRSGQYQRLFQNTGFDHTYLYGEKPTAMQIHEVGIHTSLVLHNFAHSPNGLRLTPGFIFDLLNGPSLPDPGGADLPAQLYTGYLDTAWRPQLTPRFAADLGLRVGVYSDFKTVTSNSIRFTGVGLGVLQITPTLALKLGIEYYDRLSVKILPAGGLLWTPNEKTVFDIYFPRPKLAQYWTTIGNADIWWHFGCEYGGSSWTIDRIGAPPAFVGFSQRIDYNDIRLFTGINWKGLNERTGYLEIGYVFDRELIFDPISGLAPNESTELDDTFMVRGGIAF